MIDRSAPQVEQTRKLFADDSSIQVHQFDLISDVEAIQKLGSMDLIYCRWVVCHLPNDQRVAAISAVLKCLKPGGVFFLEDGDNTTVCYQTKDGAALPGYAEEANKSFHETAGQICKLANIDLQFNADKQVALLAEASDDIGSIERLGLYCIKLKTRQQKQLLSVPWRTAIEIIFKAKGWGAVDERANKQFIETAIACDEDDNIAASFLTQSITVYRAPK